MGKHGKAGGRLNLLNFIIYNLFGAVATAVNMGSYFLLYDIAGLENVPAVFLSWLFAVSVAFCTNKFFVFRSHATDHRTVLRELWQFFSCRISTGILDIVIMYIAVDRLHADAVLWKLISNLIVGLINYLVGQLVIFARKELSEHSHR